MSKRLLEEISSWKAEAKLEGSERYFPLRSKPAANASGSHKSTKGLSSEENCVSS